NIALVSLFLSLKVMVACFTSPEEKSSAWYYLRSDLFRNYDLGSNSGRSHNITMEHLPPEVFQQGLIFIGRLPPISIGVEKFASNNLESCKNVIWGIILRVRADGWSYPGASEASKILKNPHHQRMRIGELARSVDVNVETIRYYQRIRLLGLPKKPYGGMRFYDDEHLQRLRFIRRAQQLGFSLEDIRAL